MSEGPQPQEVTAQERAWAAAVASSRGVTLDAADADAIVVAVRPLLERFRRISAELAADDDMYEFRRLLTCEAGA